MAFYLVPCRLLEWQMCTLGQHVVENPTAPVATAIVMHLGKGIAATTTMSAFGKLRMVAL